MRPFDPQLLRTAPAARRPVAALAAVGVLQGIATVATAFALTALVVAVVVGLPVGRPVAWLLAVFTVRAALAWVAERTAAWAGVRVSSSVREQLLASWLSRAADGRPDPARAVTLAAQGAASVEPYVARYLPSLITAAAVPPLAILTLGLVDWPSAVIVLLTVPLLPVFAALIGASTRESTERRWRALSRLSGHFLDVMRGLPTLVSYGRAERQTATIAEVSQRHRRATLETLRLAFLSSAALELLATLSVAMVAVTVGIRLAHGSMALGTALVAILLAPEAYWPIRRVGAEFHSAADGAAALVQISSELAPSSSPAAVGAATPTSPDDAGDGDRGGAPVPAPAASVTARALRYSYPGAADPVLDGVDLTAGVGLTVLTGPSGTGKTTLLEVLAGLRAAEGGQVSAAPAHLAGQRAFLTADTVRANLSLGTGAGAAAMWEALRDVGLEGVVASLPQGLDTPLGDDGFGLSAGQRSRLALARALLSPATVVLLDEPTAHLDGDAVGIAHGAIARLAERRCVIAVTHRRELVALADQHVHLRAGRASTGVGQ